ncbi:MAG: gamma carbonic anhydrase family protein [Verrucomicrobiota bacterium]
MPEAPFLAETPKIHPSAWVAPSADVMGAVTLEENASVWFNTVLRADIERIVIGPGSNVQDGSVVHLERTKGTTLGQFVTVGHKATLHACDVDDEVLVGMGSIVMDHAEVGAQSIIGAGALVTMGTKIPPGSLVLGSPAKVVRALDAEERKALKGWALNYTKLLDEYRAKFG